VIPIQDDNPLVRTPLLTYTVMALCALTFLWQLTLGGEGFRRAVFAFGVIPAVLSGRAALPPELALIPAPLTIFTSMFLHGGIMHLLGNLLFLWIFSDNVEDRLGRWRFALFYLCCGIGAALAQVLPEPGSKIPMIGASGAISGVLGAYMIMYPHAQVRVVVPVFFVLQIVRLPALLVLGFWFLIQLLSSLLAQPGTGGVAFRAHIGGFVAGLILLPLFRPRRHPGRS
jgi:membrane associated rhomboid family serine protease